MSYRYVLLSVCACGIGFFSLEKWKTADDMRFKIPMGTLLQLKDDKE